MTKAYQDSDGNFEPNIADQVTPSQAGHSLGNEHISHILYKHLIQDRITKYNNSINQAVDISILKGASGNGGFIADSLKHENFNLFLPVNVGSHWATAGLMKRGKKIEIVIFETAYDHYYLPNGYFINNRQRRNNHAEIEGAITTLRAQGYDATSYSGVTMVMDPIDSSKTLQVASDEGVLNTCGMWSAMFCDDLQRVSEEKEGVPTKEDLKNAIKNRVRTCAYASSNEPKAGDANRYVNINKRAEFATTPTPSPQAVNEGVIYSRPPVIIAIKNGFRPTTQEELKEITTSKESAVRNAINEQLVSCNDATIKKPEIYCGIGIEVKKQNGQWIIINIATGSPAADKLNVQEVLQECDNLTAEELAAKFRGPIGTKIQINKQMLTRELITTRGNNFIPFKDSNIEQHQLGDTNQRFNS